MNTISKNTAPIPLGKFGTSTDTMDGKKSDKALQKNEERFRPAMEASGVTYDFNSILQIILGYSDLLLDKQDPQNPARTNISEIRKAAARFAGLTRQFLFLTRQQIVSPKVIDFKETVSDLQRIIGEEIDLVWMPSQDLWKGEMK